MDIGPTFLMLVGKLVDLFVYLKYKFHRERTIDAEEFAYRQAAEDNKRDRERQFTPQVQEQIRAFNRTWNDGGGYQPVPPDRPSALPSRPPNTQSGVYVSNGVVNRASEVAQQIRTNPQNGAQIVSDYLSENTETKKYKVVDNKFVEIPKSRLESLIIDGE